MIWILRSPFHSLVSRQIAVITFTGRKSGRKFTTPVTYYAYNGKLLLFTHRLWWKNLTNSAPVTMILRGQERHGLASATNDSARMVAELRAFIAHYGIKQARMLGLEIAPTATPQQISDTELAAFARQRALIYIALDDV
jgi:hypothetical protein